MDINEDDGGLSIMQEESEVGNFNEMPAYVLYAMHRG